MSIEIQVLGPAIGALIRGIQLSKPLSDSNRDLLLQPYHRIQVTRLAPTLGAEIQRALRTTNPLAITTGDKHDLGN